MKAQNFGDLAIARRNIMNSIALKYVSILFLLVTLVLIYVKLGKKKKDKNDELNRRANIQNLTYFVVFITFAGGFFMGIGRENANNSKEI